MTKIDRKIALFDIEEVQLGKKLGSGGFSDVYEICSFVPSHDGIMSKNRRMKKAHQEARSFLMEHATRTQTGETRYAIKFVKESLLDDCEKFDCGAQDLAFEADLLSSLNHPNILKIRGWATHGYEAYFKSHRHDGYFIIVDKLNETLTDKIALWKRLLDSPNTSKRLRRTILLEQIKVAMDIANALEYLHDNGLIYRDLKPDNIGFDVRGETKLFDFGLARQMPKSKHNNNSGSSSNNSNIGPALKDVFRMSGKVGTARYMAPEVCLSKPYNTKADVYSYSHVMYEIMSMMKPYDNFTKGMHKTQVVQGGERPEIHPEWPQVIQDILSQAWHPNLQQRPTMKEIRSRLQAEITSMEQQISEPTSTLTTEGEQQQQQRERQEQKRTIRRQSTHYELEEQLKEQQQQQRQHPSKERSRLLRSITRRNSLATRAA